MAQWDVNRLRHRLRRVWLLSPERLWLLTITLHRRGYKTLAFAIKQLNAVLYHNSLPPGATVSSDIRLGHNSYGIMINPQVTIGRRVKIWHNVTLTTRSPKGSPARIVIEDDVMIGANAVVVTPRGRVLTLGRGARIGAGVVVTRDVPAGATVVCAPPRVLNEDEAEALGETVSEF